MSAHLMVTQPRRQVRRGPSLFSATPAMGMKKPWATTVAPITHTELLYQDPAPCVDCIYDARYVIRLPVGGHGQKVVTIGSFKMPNITRGLPVWQ